MTSFVLSLLVLVGQVAQSQEMESYNCAARLLSVPRWDTVLSSVTECLKKSDDFNNGLSRLCTPDRIEFSDTYQRFIKYKLAYDHAVLVLQSMKSPTARAHNKVVRTKEDWEILGNYGQVTTLIEHMKTSYHMCGG